MNRNTLSAAVLGCLLPLRQAAACPFCGTETGRQVQAGIFNEGFWNNVLLMLLPILALLAVVALIHFDFSWIWKKLPLPADTANATYK